MVVQVNNNIDGFGGVKYWWFSAFQQLPFYVKVVSFLFWGVGEVLRGGWGI